MNSATQQNRKKRKNRALKLFELQESLMIDTFVIKITQFEKLDTQIKLFLNLKILKENPLLELKARLFSNISYEFSKTSFGEKYVEEKQP